MLSASRLAQLIVSTRDLPAAADFYLRRLGLPLLAEDGEEVRIDAGGGEIRLCRERFAPSAGGPPCVLVFLVNDLATTGATLAARGVPCGRSRWHDIGVLASVRDPDGHRIVLCQPSPAALYGPVGPVVREMRQAYLRTPWTPGPLIAVVVDEDRHAGGAGLYHHTLGLALLARRRCCEEDGCRQPETFTVYDAGGVLLVTRTPDAAPPAGAHRTIVPVFEVCGADRLLAALAGRGFRVTPHRPRRLSRCEDPLGQSICVVDVGAQMEPVLPAAHR